MYLRNNQYRPCYFTVNRILCYCLLFFISTTTKAQTDSAATNKTKEEKFNYFRIGIDASKFISSAISTEYDAYEMQMDIHYKKQMFLVSEFGFGHSIVENDYLKYNCNNIFIRVGMDKTLFDAEFKGDYSNGLIGLRYGLGMVQRGAATYAIQDPVWGNTTGAIPSASFLAHWIELSGGFKMEVFKNIFAGWNIRFKTFLNPKKFEKLPPSYLAGYGKADKNTAFGYNFYVLFGFGKRK